jgi:hypothetical protein
MPHLFLPPSWVTLHHLLIVMLAIRMIVELTFLQAIGYRACTEKGEENCGGCSSDFASVPRAKLDSCLLMCHMPSNKSLVPSTMIRPPRISLQPSHFPLHPLYGSPLRHWLSQLTWQVPTTSPTSTYHHELTSASYGGALHSIPS